MQTHPQISHEILHKLNQLSPAPIEEVNDFIDFLRLREQQIPTATIAKISEPALAHIWDNEEDAVYDRL